MTTAHSVECGAGPSVDAIDRYAAEHPQLVAQAHVGGMLRNAVGCAISCRGLIVDVGCGEGTSLSAVGSLAPDATILGLDLSFRRAAVARSRGPLVGVADGLRLPIRQHSAALVISRHVIEHIEDDAAALTELHRVLRPDGILYLETPLRLPGAWYPYQNAAGRRVLDPTHVREYETVADVERLLSRAGFKMVEHDIARIRFPAGHLVHRLVRPTRHATGALARMMTREWLAIPIPRYRELRVIAAPGGDAAHS